MSWVVEDDDGILAAAERPSRSAFSRSDLKRRSSLSAAMRALIFSLAAASAAFSRRLAAASLICSFFASSSFRSWVSLVDLRRICWDCQNIGESRIWRGGGIYFGWGEGLLPRCAFGPPCLAGTSSRASPSSSPSARQASASFPLPSAGRFPRSIRQIARGRIWRRGTRPVLGFGSASDILRISSSGRLLRSLKPGVRRSGRLRTRWLQHQSLAP